MNDIVKKITDADLLIDSFPAGNNEEVEHFRIKFLGSKGLITGLFDEFRTVPVPEKKEIGRMLNDLKKKAGDRYNRLKEVMESADTGENKFDLSLPAEPVPLGSNHPVSIIRNRIITIFERTGFSVAEGPEIETGWYNFGALNFPEDHPAMDMQDTFYIQSGSTGPSENVLLRTHTSSVQIRVMEKTPPPVKVICPGRVYRNETITARSHCFFHQVEGLYVDENISFPDLKQTLFYFAREMFGTETNVRFRPSYFPFTEPSGEVDISCLICKSKGCPVCKNSGWVEILGCGMVHPAVLANCKIDPVKYTGYAFGMGIERIAMLMYRIDDIRILFENDVRFLRQFSGSA
ncbi:MAG: phenylalanine--tRNA ligase subunit alpha [Bacteroidetes bacterium]|nr:phenylalanine--tRNA ligase subunit alpha [Bacteroidota bacterium]